MRDTRKILAFGWSGFAMLMIGFTLIKFGEAKEILTLVIGMLNFIIGAIFGVYFSASNHPKQEPGTATIDIQATAETTKDE